MTHRSGSSAMLSLVYSEILKLLRLWSLLEFDCEIFFPHDHHGLPKGYHKQKSVESDQLHIMTTETLLQEVSPGRFSTYQSERVYLLLWMPCYEFVHIVFQVK